MSSIRRPFVSQPLSNSLLPLAVLALAVLASQAHAESLPIDPTARLKLGLNASFNHSEYATSETMTVLPQAFYDNNRLYAEGSEAGVYAFKDANNQLRAGVSYDGQSFDPKDGDTKAIQQLDKRDWSALAGVSYMRITPYGGFKAKVATDILGRSKGTVATLAYLSKFNYNKWTIYPEIGAKWANDKYNNYYYGISQAEATKSGLATYTAKSSVNPYASLTGSYAFDPHWSGFVSQHIGYLSSEQKNSPMVDNRLDLTTKVGFNYQF